MLKPSSAARRYRYKEGRNDVFAGIPNSAAERNLPVSGEFEPFLGPTSTDSLPCFNCVLASHGQIAQCTAVIFGVHRRSLVDCDHRDRLSRGGEASARTLVVLDVLHEGVGENVSLLNIPGMP